MAKYPSMVLTKEGLSMIAESQGGSGLIFTKVALGAGDLNSGSIIDLTNLIDLKLNANITAIDATSRPGQVTLTAIVSNSEVEAGFHAKELGVFAKIGESGTERLYAYTNAGNYADYMPDKNNPVNEAIFKTTFVVSNAQNIQAVIDKSIVYPTVLEMDRAIEKHNTGDDSHENIFNGFVKGVSSENGTLTVTNGAGENTAVKVVDIATKDEAEEGTENTKPMSALRVWDAIKKFAISPALTGTPTAPTAAKGTNTTQIATTEFVFQNANPVGTIIAMAYTGVPAGYLHCNGAAVSRTTYAALFALLGTYYGAGDGVTTFNLPQTVAKFLEGGVGAGTYYAAGLPNVRQYIGRTEYNNSYPPVYPTDIQDGWTFTDTKYTGESIASSWVDLASSNAIYGNSTTVQPPAMTVIYCIKY